MAHAEYLKLLLFIGVCAQCNVFGSSSQNDISCSVNLSRIGCQKFISNSIPKLPIYVYPSLWEYNPSSFDPYLLHMMIWLSNDNNSIEVSQVFDPSDACLFLVTAPSVAICDSSKINCGYYELWEKYSFKTYLSHWGKGDESGMNHIIYMPAHSDWEITNYPTDKAMLIRSASTIRTFWPQVDVQMPFYIIVCNSTTNQICIEHQQIDGRVSSFLPNWVKESVFAEDLKLNTISKSKINLQQRSLLGGFIGAIRIAGAFISPAPDLTIGNRLRVSLSCLHSPNKNKFIIADPSDAFDLFGFDDGDDDDEEEELNFKREKKTIQNSFLPDQGKYHGKVWGDYYWRTLLNSYYAICPSGAGSHSQRINEAIAAGAVPVVFDDDVQILPFEDHDIAASLWFKCVIRIPNSDVDLDQLIQMLTSHLNNKLKLPGDDDVDDNSGGEVWRWARRRSACRELHERFFASHDMLLESAFSSINRRIRKSNSTSLCQWRRPLAIDLDGFNGFLPGEDTPFPARERMASLSYGRRLHVPSFHWNEIIMTMKKSNKIVENIEEKISEKLESKLNIDSIKFIVSQGDNQGVVGTYQEGLYCIREHLIQYHNESEQNISFHTPLDPFHSSDDVIKKKKLTSYRRMMHASLALGEESAQLGQYDRALNAYKSCRLIYNNIIDFIVTLKHDNEDDIVFNQIELSQMKTQVAWCEYITGLIIELYDENQGIDLGESNAFRYYKQALIDGEVEALGWSSLRNGTITEFVEHVEHVLNQGLNLDDQNNVKVDSDGNDDKDNADVLSRSMNQFSDQSNDQPTLPLVELFIDPVSWLAWEFNHDQIRKCHQSQCQTKVSHFFQPSSNDYAAYLTSFGGRPDDISLPRRSSKHRRHHHLNAVVFMENDARIFPNGRDGLSLALEQNVLPQLGLGLGYRSTAPWNTAASAFQIPWKKVSYINDPLERFIQLSSNYKISEKSNFKKISLSTNLNKNDIGDDDDDGLIPGVAFFSSQCDPQFATARLAIVTPLIEAFKQLNIRFASFGQCFHTEDIQTSLPQCASLPRHTVDHDDSKSCVLSRFAFTLAIENSEDEGYATEKLWQPLLAGSVPIYWGAPTVKTMLPSSTAAVHIRDFNGSMSELAKHIQFLLTNKSEYEKYHFWKTLSPNQWSSEFLELINIRKEKIFCIVCDYAIEYSNQKLNTIKEEEGVDDDDVLDDSLLYIGYFKLNVLNENGDMVEHQIDIPHPNQIHAEKYAPSVCHKVATNLEGCEAITNEIARLQQTLISDGTLTE